MAKALILAAALAIHAADSDHLSFINGYKLSSEISGFGGFSAMHMNDDCSEMTLVSDDGWWLRANLQYDNDGKLAPIKEAEILPLLNNHSQRANSKILRDAEAITQLPDGKFIVGFESRARLESFSSLKSPGRRVAMPGEIAKGPDNGELEAMAYIPEGLLSGQFIVVSESNRDEQDHPRAWHWSKANMPIRFSVDIPQGLAITDMQIMPGGENMLLLGRKFFPGFSSMVILRANLHEIHYGGVLATEILYEAHGPFANVDNMEAMALCKRDDQLRLTIMSDDNYLPGLQLTILYQFELKP